MPHHIQDRVPFVTAPGKTGVDEEPIQSRPMQRRRFLSPFLFSLALTAIAVGCGSPAPSAGSSASETQGSERSGATDGWAGMDREALVARVRELAVLRAQSRDPSIDLAARGRWLAGDDLPSEIGDRASEQLMNLAVSDLAAGELDAATGTIALVRERARNRNNAFAGNTLLVVATRLRAEASGEDQAAAIAEVLRQLPRARFGAATVAFQLYQDPAQISAALERIHGQLLTLDTAASALFVEHVLGDVVAHRDTYLAAIAAVRAENDARPDDAAHDFGRVDLAGARDAQPVVVAVWDTGVATELFGAGRPLGDRLFSATIERPGAEPLVTHGVIADPDPAQTAYTFEPGADVIAEYAPFLRGVMDLRTGMASTEAAQRVLALMRSATDRESLERLNTALDAVGEWAHGTHVAGILVEGLPQARLAIFRSAWAGETRVYRHRGPTDEELALERENIEQIAAFIRAHGVRVVNASLGFEEDYVAAELGFETDTYTSEEAIEARAREVIAQRRANWARIFELCPDTLFVISAGNSNHDVTEYGTVASSIAAPNVMAIGAVDRFGNWATFTNSNPELVRVFDYGVEVESFIPNGERIPLSGTSMASPNAANTAAKLFSVDPSLTPAQVVALIQETGTPIAAPFNGVIVHQARALERARAQRAAR